MVILYSNKRLEYWDGDKLKGEILIEGAIARKIDTFEADDQENAFEITNPAGESILFAAESLSVADEWIYKLYSVINNTWKIDIKCKQLSQLFGLKPAEYFTFDEAYNKSELLNELSTVGGVWRYEPIYYDEYFSTLISRVTSYLRIINFEAKFLSACSARKIRIRPSMTVGGEGYKNKSFHCSVTPDGILLIEFQTGTLIITNIACVLFVCLYN